jgi:hypothetical protein
MSQLSAVPWSIPFVYATFGTLIRLWKATNHAFLRMQLTFFASRMYTFSVQITPVLGTNYASCHHNHKCDSFESFKLCSLQQYCLFSQDRVNLFTVPISLYHQNPRPNGIHMVLAAFAVKTIKKN